MKLLLIVLIVALCAGEIFTSLFFYFLRKKTKKYEVKVYLKLTGMVFIILLTGIGCSPCRNVTGSKYMVWVLEGAKKNHDCVENTADADAYIFKKSGLPLTTDSLIGKRKPYLYLDNGDYEIYVEKESLRRFKLRNKNDGAEKR